MKQGATTAPRHPSVELSMVQLLLSHLRHRVTMVLLVLGILWLVEQQRCLCECCQPCCAEFQILLLCCFIRDTQSRARWRVHETIIPSAVAGNEQQLGAFSDWETATRPTARRWPALRTWPPIQRPRPPTRPPPPIKDQVSALNRCCNCAVAAGVL